MRSVNLRTNKRNAECLRVQVDRRSVTFGKGSYTFCGSGKNFCGASGRWGEFCYPFKSVSKIVSSVIAMAREAATVRVKSRERMGERERRVTVSPCWVEMPT